MHGLRSATRPSSDVQIIRSQRNSKNSVQTKHEQTTMTAHHTTPETSTPKEHWEVAPNNPKEDCPIASDPYQSIPVDV
jgi:hypothetical protein